MPSRRSLGQSSFAGDDGAASPQTRQRLAAAEDGTPPAYLSAVAALCTDRLLVPVVATVSRAEQAVGGPRSDKEAEMALVSVRSPDGRRAALAFSGLDALQAWQHDARPVPVTLDVVARTALADDAAAVVVDIAGPHPLVLEDDLLGQLAAGHRLVEPTPGEFGWLQVGTAP